MYYCADIVALQCGTWTVVRQRSLIIYHKFTAYYSYVPFDNVFSLNAEKTVVCISWSKMIRYNKDYRQGSAHLFCSGETQAPPTFFQGGGGGFSTLLRSNFNTTK